MLPHLFVAFWLNGRKTDLRLETEGHHVASFDVGGGGGQSLVPKSRLQGSNLVGERKIDADF